MQKIDASIEQLTPIGFSFNYQTISKEPVGIIDQRNFDFFDMIYIVDSPIIKPKGKDLKYAPWGITDNRLKTHIDVMDVHQFQLPFFEYRKIDSTQWLTLKKKKFPSFDRNIHGHLFEKKIKSIFKPNYRTWCYDNCIGRYYVANSSVFFEKSKDYEACLLVSFNEYED